MSTSPVLVLKTAKSIVINSNTPHQCQLSTEVVSAGARKERCRCRRRRSVGGRRLLVLVDLGRGRGWGGHWLGPDTEVASQEHEPLLQPEAVGRWREGEGPGLGPQLWRRRVDGDGCAMGIIE